jgi:hypothetical protein
MVNYITTLKHFALEHRITDCSDVASGEYIINHWYEYLHDSVRTHVCYMQVVSRTKKYITIMDENNLVKLSWNEEGKYWGKNQGYQCRTYISQDELPEGLEIIE